MSDKFDNAQRLAQPAIVVKISARRWVVATHTGAEQLGDGPVCLLYAQCPGRPYRREAQAITDCRLILAREL